MLAGIYWKRLLWHLQHTVNRSGHKCDSKWGTAPHYKNCCARATVLPANDADLSAKSLVDVRIGKLFFYTAFV